jgi:hypothetical protein
VLAHLCEVAVFGYRQAGDSTAVSAPW